MSDISFGAVGAAIIAGLVSTLGLIIGKEQKVSEFRQAWINDLRKCMVSYLVSINAIADAIRSSKINKAITTPSILSEYKSLNEANHGIALRINADEQPAKTLLKAMSEFESIASDNAKLTPEVIRLVELEFIQASKDLLKFEWKRVKRGEMIFVWTKRVLLASIAIMCLLFASLYYYRTSPSLPSPSSPIQIFLFSR